VSELIHTVVAFAEVTESLRVLLRAGKLLVHLHEVHYGLLSHLVVLTARDSKRGIHLDFSIFAFLGLLITESAHVVVLLTVELLSFSAIISLHVNGSVEESVTHRSLLVAEALRDLTLTSEKLLLSGLISGMFFSALVVVPRSLGGVPVVRVVVSSLLRCKTQDLRLQSLGTALLVEGLELILCKL
jgi:hypothetical protein